MTYSDGGYVYDVKARYAHHASHVGEELTEATFWFAFKGGLSVFSCAFPAK